MNNQFFEEPIEYLDDNSSFNNNPDYSNTTFDNFSKKEEIGILPPDIDPKKPKKNGFKKVFITFIILLSIAAVAFGIYYYLSLANSRAKKKVEVKNLVFDMGTSLSSNPLDYGTFKGISASNCYVDLTSVDINVAGKYSYKIVCGNEEFNGTLEIKDTVKPVVVSQSVVKMLNDDILPEDFIASCEDSSSCKYSFRDSNYVKEAITKVGEYEIEIIVSDASDNSVYIKETLSVVAKKVSYTLTCLGNVYLDSNSDYSRYQEDTLSFDDENLYMNIASRSITYSYFNTTLYAKDKGNGSNTNYKEYTGTVSYDDSKMQVVINSVIAKDTLKKEMDSSYSDNFNDIKTYYENNNFTCTKK